jgi:hypothetical protein
MARKGRRQAAVTSKNLVMNGGLNYAQSPANIADNELTRAANMIYDPDTDQLMARPGCSIVTSVPLTGGITSAYYYVKDSTTAYHIAACGDKLYYLDGTTYSAIGTIESGSSPSFVTFNSKLLIADGGTGIKTWDGTTYSAITTSPNASSLTVIKNRVVANAVDEDDSVYMSKTNDETDWDTTSSAIGLKAGFGDLLSVNAFGVYNDDLIVSKTGDASKRLYRVNVGSSTTSEWYVSSLSYNNAATSANTMVGAWNNIFFIDTDGFKTLKGIQEYGDLEVDRIGNKINTVFTSTANLNFVAYLPTYNSVWFNVSDRVFCYTERYDPNGGSLKTGARVPAFTDLFFAFGRVNVAYEANDIVYLCGNNGHLYKLDELLSLDNGSNYICAVKTKTFSYFDDIMLRKIQWYLRPKLAGTGVLNLCYSENDKVQLKSFSFVSSGTLLYDSTGYLDAANEYIYEAGMAPWTEETRNRYRGTDIAFEVEMYTGRAGVEWCKAEIAELEGGE